MWWSLLSKASPVNVWSVIQTIARQIQQGLLPSSSPKIQGYEIADWSKPAEQAGGDYYNWLPLPNGQIGINRSQSPALSLDKTDTGMTLSPIWQRRPTWACIANRL